MIIIKVQAALLALFSSCVSHLSLDDSPLTPKSRELEDQSENNVVNKSLGAARKENWHRHEALHQMEADAV